MSKQQAASPDFKGAAQQQAAASQANTDAQTAANRANQTNAFGASSQWTKGPDGQWTQTSSLGGPLGQAAQGAMQGAAAGPLSFGAAPGLTTGDAARNQAIDSAFTQARSRLDPMWQQREQSERSRLAAQGLDPNGEAAQNAMGNLGRERNDAYNSALASAVGQGTEAGNALFQQSLQARQQGVGEAQALHGSNYQDLAHIQGLSQQQGYNMAGRADAPDYLAAAQAQGAFDQGNAAQANSMWGNIAGAAGAVAGAAIPFAFGGNPAQRRT